MSAALDALRTRFVARCAEDRARLAEARAAEDQEALKLLAHKLAGAAGTFGFPALGEAAMAVEDALDLGSQPDSQSLDDLDRLLAEAAAA